MLAIAAVESGGGDPREAGHNCGPRLEPAYDVNGGFWSRSQIQQHLVATWGSLAASSFGPWQMMFCNFSEGMTPEIAQMDLDRLAQEFVRQFNQFARRWQFTTLDQIGQVWNEGHEAPDPAYTDKLEAAYTDTAGVLA
jgi:hypothetical protein